MNILDIIIIIVLLMFVITGFKRGVFRELVSLVGTILMFIIAYILKTPIGNFMCRVLPFFELPDGNNIYNVLLFQILAFIIVFALLLSFYEVFVSFSESIQKVINITIVLWLPSKILGSVVAFVKGLIIIFLVLLLVMVPTKGKELIDNSMLAPKILDETPVLSDMSKDYLVF